VIKNKNMLFLSGHCGEVASPALPADPAGSAGLHLSSMLERLSCYFKGEKDANPAPDPAMAIIAEISDPEVRTMVQELHCLTPPSLKTMREACEECFFLPDDCSYVDYSIPDVNKAVRRIHSHPELSASPGRVVSELAKVNGELARHLQEHFDLEEKQ